MAISIQLPCPSLCIFNASTMIEEIPGPQNFQCFRISSPCFALNVAKVGASRRNLLWPDPDYQLALRTFAEHPVQGQKKQHDENDDTAYAAPQTAMKSYGGPACRHRLGRGRNRPKGPQLPLPSAPCRRPTMIPGRISFLAPGCSRGRHPDDSSLCRL